MFSKKLITLLMERGKYFLGYYILGYLISLMQSGVPNLYYLIPLKPFAIAFGWGMGNADYKTSKEVKKMKVVRLPVYIYFYHVVRYVPALILTGIYTLLISIIGFIFEFDIAPFIAPF